MEKGATSQGCRRPSEARKGKGKDSPLQSPERNVNSANTFFKKFIYFIYFWLGWVFVVARRLSLAVESRGYSSLRCAGFSLLWLLLLQSTGMQASVVAAHVLSSCGSRAQLLHGMWDPPRLGLEPRSPALAGGLLTTVPPGKPSANTFDFSSGRPILDF